MSYFVKNILISLFFVFSTFKAEAEEFWRFRYLVPTSTETEISINSNTSKTKLNTLGHSAHLIFFNGIGVGYSTFSKKGSIDDIYYKFLNHSLDLSYTIGDTFSFTFGIGQLVYGKGELNKNEKNYITENSSGELLFFGIGVPFIIGELIIGYRQYFSEYNNYQTKVNNESIILSDSVKLNSSQIDAGVGILF
tara:strand:- start:155 stop:733 length:579 start_codon:yes stop_codon:yes gene_type:complete